MIILSDMKILLISARYLPHRGGLESVVSHLAQQFKAQGNVVTIVTNRYPRSLSAFEVIEDVPVHRLHFVLPEAKYLKNRRIDLWLAGMWYQFATVYQLKKIIKQFQPDVINNHYLNEVAELTGKCLENYFPSIPWVISLHGGDVDGEPFFSAAHRERFAHWAERADALTACSRFLAAQAEQLDPALKGKVQIIHNGVDAERFAQAQPYSSSKPYILAVGQLSQHKGFDLLIRAFAKIAPNHPYVQLLIAGEGDQRHVLENLIQEYKLSEQIKLLGKVDEAQVAALMAGCLFVAMPSRREPFGIVALEGMATGKPVLATPVGGLPEFLPCPPNKMVPLEEGAWTNALEQWLNLAEAGNLIADKNQIEARAFTWSAVAENFLRAYQDATYG